MRSLYRERDLQVIFGVTLMTVLPVASVSPALPKVSEALGVSDVRIGLLVTAFSLPGIVLSPLAGVAADRYGRKRVLVPALVLFAFSGVACAVARDFGQLLLFRGLQGVGSAPLGVLVTTLIGDLYSGRDRAAAMGYNSTVLHLGAAAYPVVGGTMALFAWYYPFLLSALALPVGVLVLFLLRNPEPQEWFGARDYAFGVMRQMASLRVAVYFSAGLLTFILIYGTILTYFTLYLADRFGASTLSIGLVLTLMSLTTAAASSQLMRVSKWTSLRRVVWFAFGAYGLSMFLVPVTPSLYLMAVPAMIFGAANGFNRPALVTSVAEVAPLEQRGAFMAANMALVRLGQTVGPLVIGLVWTFLGEDEVFLVSGAVAILAVGAGALLRGRLGSIGAEQIGRAGQVGE